jgi:hypothetical protein
MRAALAALICVSATLFCGCRSHIEVVPGQFFEDDHVSNYRLVFELSPTEDIDVLNSVIVTYDWRLGLNGADDWAFELIVPPAWVERTARVFHLSRGEGQNLAITAINQRKEHPIRSWYAPKPINDYELYYLDLTSIPYIHMLVDDEPELDGRLHVFISKH